jgi:hypothetical protein
MRLDLYFLTRPISSGKKNRNILRQVFRSSKIRYFRSLSNLFDDVLIFWNTQSFAGVEANAFQKVTKTKHVFLNIYGTQESIPRNEFRQPM